MNSSSLKVPTIGDVIKVNQEIAEHKNSKFLFHFKDSKTTFSFEGVEWELRMFSFYLVNEKEGSIRFYDYVNSKHDLSKELTLAVIPSGLPIYFWAVNDSESYINLSLRPIN